MYLPTNVYERVPYYWTVLGIVLIAMGTLLGALGHGILALTGVGGGAMCCIWARVVLQRRRAQELVRQRENYDGNLDQTMELNSLNVPPVIQPAPEDFRAQGQ